MKGLKKLLGYFTRFELTLWLSSVGAILLFFLIFDRSGYLTLRRNPYFALAYAANDVVLIVLWVMASISDVSYVSVAVYFAVFFINDLYGFANWLKMKSRQAEIKGQNSLEKQKVK